MIEWRGELTWHFMVTLYEVLVGFALSIVVSIPLGGRRGLFAVPAKYDLSNPAGAAVDAEGRDRAATGAVDRLWRPAENSGGFPGLLLPDRSCHRVGIVGGAAALIDLIRSLSATSTQTFVKIRFPTAIPHIFVGLKIAITFAVIGGVIGEFVGSDEGLGYLILISTSQSRTPLAFGALLLLTIMSIVLYYAVEFIERLVVPWAPRN